MKILYIESKLKDPELTISPEEIKKLPNKIFLAYSIQYKEVAKKIKKQLEKNKIKVSEMQQVLGCSKIKANYPVLFIGTGKFHALNLFLQNPAVYIIESNRIKQVSKEEILKLKAKRQTALIKFLKAEKIGILLSTKPGQENIKLAQELKEKLKKQGKQAYIFLSNDINIAEFENFDIDSWINTACPGLSYDNPDIINYDEIDIVNDILN